MKKNKRSSGDGSDYCQRTIMKEESKVSVDFKLYDKHSPDKVRTGQAEDLIG